MVANAEERRPAFSAVKRWVVAALLGVALIAGSVAYTWSQTLGRSHPETALAIWPWSSSAQAKLAEAALTKTKAPAAPEIANAKRLAERALARDPLNVRALRTLGLIASLHNQPERARALIKQAERVSRRDLPTELWLIEDRVAAGDVAGALVHYDHALRTSRRGRQLLLPILSQAAEQAEIAKPLAALLATRPQWWPAFMQTHTGSTRSPDTLLMLMSALRLDPRDSNEREIMGQGLTRMAQIGDPLGAYRLHQQLAPTNGAELVRNGDFEANGGIAPFDWLITADPELGASIEPAPSGGNALRLAGTVRSATAARQLIMLPAGRYQLTAQLLGTEGTSSSVKIALECLASGKSVVVPGLSGGARDGRYVQAFSVPDHCPAAWLDIKIDAALDGQDEIFIDDVAIIAS